ncbi:hypothetical protein EXIGLDRAFT_761290 [Exidia glandulosa HHB12029]|uniref:Uncharacterized protein n=1 Tax=Exidia glandulosa HHB12029 TaxID=1314781 RepID=A0A165NNW8_EXIGL|nr:hypothetical protein EXIGLDRAFT_761290 [Exidia glandulosa HHB12029]
MFRTIYRSLVLVTVALPLASAFINDVQPFNGTYSATSTSKFPVTFLTASTMVEFLDLSVSFGISTPEDHASNTTLGVPLSNVDLLALNHSSTGPGSFTIDVPISSSDLYASSGSYVLTAAVLRGTGDSAVLNFRVDPFTVSFNATGGDSDA